MLVNSLSKIEIDGYIDENKNYSFDIKFEKEV